MTYMEYIKHVYILSKTVTRNYSPPIYSSRRWALNFIGQLRHLDLENVLKVYIANRGYILGLENVLKVYIANRGKNHVKNEY